MGKAAILLVVGTGLLLLWSGRDLSDNSVTAYDNAMDYYEGGVTRYIAIAGANMAANQIFLTPPNLNGYGWWAGYTSPVSFAGGKFTVIIDSTSSVDPITGQRRLTLKSTAVYRDSTFTVRVILRPSNFAKFAFYAGASGASDAYWATGDSAFGPVHSEGFLRTTGTPYFGGKVTTLNGIDSTSWSGHPIFNAGVESGVSIPMNKSYQGLGTAAAAAGGKKFTGNDDLYLNFAGDSIKYHRASNPDTTRLLSSWCPNGAIALTTGTGTVHVQGTVKGHYTVGALDSSGSAGRVVIDGNLTYNSDPRTTPTSTDMLGIVAWNDINIKDNGSSYFTVMASLFSYTNAVTVENYDSRAKGTLYTLGGWTVQKVAATSSSDLSHGYSVMIQFDSRFASSSPPYFPGTNAYEILAWYE